MINSLQEADRLTRDVASRTAYIRQLYNDARERLGLEPKTEFR